jgi:hypothetical protein
VPAPPSSWANVLSAHKLRIRFALIFGILAGALYTFGQHQPPAFCFEVTMQSTRWGFAQLYYDIGNGVNEHDSFRVPIEGANRRIVYRFPLPEGRYWNLRFDPSDRPRSHMTLANVRIVDRAGHLVRAIPPAEIKPAQQIEDFQTSEMDVSFTTAANGNDSSLALKFAEPITLGNFVKLSFRKLARRFFISFLIGAGIGFFGARFLVSRAWPTASRLMTRLRGWGKNHRWQVVLMGAAASVVLSSYPIIFFGKSFLSPNNHSHTFLLYGEMPTVPGSTEVATDDEKGSDLGAVMWYSWPTSVVESRALLDYFELPLWNRYDSAGLPLLGQGQSMFGDPLHWLALLSRGAAGWWDLKYLLAKFVFAACLGLCVLQLTRHLPAATIVSLSASFIGFFSYRYSHPAFFSICYAPFILLCWFKLLDAPRGRPAVLWLVLMVIADWALLTSGTVKEAYVLLLTMNSCGALTLLFSDGVTGKVARLGAAIIVQLLFVIIATPFWLTFLDTLRSSWTVYDAGGVFQLQPSLLVGLFDDIFYRQLNAEELHLDPSANFLVLGSVLWFWLGGRSPTSQKRSWGLIFTTLLSLMFVFGIVPAALILQIPFLGRIYHVDNTFSCVAIVCLLVLAGFGIKAFWDDCAIPGFRPAYFRVVAALAILLALFLGATEAVQRSNGAFQIGGHLSKSPFFWGYSALLVAGLAIAPWIGRRAIKALPRLGAWTALALVLIFFLLHWRNGMHLTTPFDPYVMNPQERTNLVADFSPALALIKNRSAEPFRAAGLSSNFFPGYGGAVGVEQVDGPDPLLNRYYKSLMDISGIKLLFGSSHAGVIEEKLGDDLPLLNMLNVRYFLGSDAANSELAPTVKKIASLDLEVYESNEVWPRAFFVDQITPYASEGDFIRLLREDDGKPFAAISQADFNNQTELERLVRASAQSDRQIVPANAYALTTNSTAFKIKAPAPGLVVLTEPYVDDDLIVQVNGKVVPHFRVNSAFRGVLVPAAGEYQFSFAYWPKHLTISLWISALGVTMLTAWLGLALRYSKSGA